MFYMIIDKLLKRICYTTMVDNWQLLLQEEVQVFDVDAR